MKELSEMTKEELQDYAVQLRDEKSALEAEKAELSGKLAETNELNKTLQKRNNDLFMKVEQQGAPQGGKKEEDEDVQTCEDFAKTLKI